MKFLRFELQEIPFESSCLDDANSIGLNWMNLKMSRNIQSMLFAKQSTCGFGARENMRHNIYKAIISMNFDDNIIRSRLIQYCTLNANASIFCFDYLFVNSNYTWLQLVLNPTMSANALTFFRRKKKTHHDHLNVSGLIVFVIMLW